MYWNPKRMQNDDLKFLVSQLHNHLITLIDEEEHATKEQLLEHLQNTISTIKTMDDDDIDSSEHTKEVFLNAYKAISQQSLSSYEDTNGRFKELTHKHEETLTEYQDQEINFSVISQKFTEIHNDMNEEVKKANKTIQDLNHQLKTLEEESTVDALTKVYNRRALISYLEKMCQKNDTNFQPHLLMLDIDDFKAVNDTYGHIAGDKILIYIANILKKTLRDGDKIFRYGGEEFVVVLNRIEHEMCKTITNRLLKLIQSNTLIYKGHNIRVTASIGATIYKKNDTPDTLISRADKALYKAKNSGKNKLHADV